MAEADEPGLVGRECELEEVVRALDADAPVVIVGEAGIGRTSLVREAARRTGRRLLEGGGFATLDWLPFLALERAVGARLAGDAAFAAGAVERAVGPDVLFVDDLQWTADPTRRVVRQLAGRVALAVAVRSGSADAQELVEDLAGLGFAVVRLGPLAVEDAATVARARRPGLEPARARSLAELGGGNPFVVGELAAAGPGSASLRLALASRLGALTAAAREGLATLALAARPVPREAVTGAAELLGADLAIAVGEAIAVRNPLLADAVEAALAPEERTAAHERLAAIVEDAGERARHLATAGRQDQAHGLALTAAESSSTPGERAANLGLAAATATGEAADDLRIRAAVALRMAGDLAGADALLDAVATTSRETRALVDAVRARVAWSRGDPEAMRAAVDHGLELVGGSGSVGEALLRAEGVTITALVDGRFEAGLADVEAALELARRSGADPTRALLLRATILTALDLDGWAAALENVVEAARAADDPETELSAANNLVAGHEMHGRPEAGRALAASMLDRAGELRLTAWQRQFGAMLANLDLHAGRLWEALARAESLLEEPLDPLAEQQTGLVAALARVDLGRPDEAGPLLERLMAAAAPDVTGRGDVLFVQAEAAFWGGRPTEALDLLDGYREYAGSEYPTSFLVDVAAGWAALEAGRPLPDRMARGSGGGMLAGAALERDGIEALSSPSTGAGESESAEAAAAAAAAASAFRAAAEAYRGYHRRGELRAGWAEGEARRRAGDAAGARVVLASVEEAALADGFVGIVGRVRRSLRLAGLRRAASSTTVDVATGLTARERELSGLVRRGLTNAEIARRMGLGRPTVARILSNAMLKVGADSRTQLAARLGELV